MKILNFFLWIFRVRIRRVRENHILSASLTEISVIHLNKYGLCFERLKYKTYQYYALEYWLPNPTKLKRITKLKLIEKTD